MTWRVFRVCSVLVQEVMVGCRVNQGFRLGELFQRRCGLV